MSSLRLGFLAAMGVSSSVAYPIRYAAMQSIHEEDFDCGDIVSDRVTSLVAIIVLIAFLLQIMSLLIRKLWESDYFMYTPPTIDYSGKGKSTHNPLPFYGASCDPCYM